MKKLSPTQRERRRCARIVDGFVEYIEKSPEPKYGGFKDKSKLMETLGMISAAIRRKRSGPCWWHKGLGSCNTSVIHYEIERRRKEGK